MNALQFEKSPYLLQHAENPVDWLPWGEKAFERAKAENKLIFLSIGYAACHWCHVMAHESFVDPGVAAILNHHFISVKVDREERPDVDSVYMAACAAMTGNGGWPLTVLLTPEQKPFWAGTYLKKPQLISLLNEASRLWERDPERIEKSGEQITGFLQNGNQPKPGEPSKELLRTAVETMQRHYDSLFGGFGAAPKFPTPHNLLFLLRYHLRTQNDEALRMAEGTLEHMFRGGIFDHIGGGFSRYSTDGKWLAPHFEKMLYDNALLAMLYTEAYQMTGEKWYADVARRTLEYAIRELRNDPGGFCCSQDADSDGVEGKYYLFTQDELYHLLGADAPGFCRRFGVSKEGNFHGKNILNLIGNPNWKNAASGLETTLREKLYNYRKGRTKLLLDDKVLTGWNGLMIAALARAGLILEEPFYLSTAARTVSFIEEHLREENGNLLAVWRGEAVHPAKLEDCTFYAWGLLELYQVTFDPALLEKAAALADHLLSDFFDEASGGFYLYGINDEQLITRTKEVYDGALPSGNAAAALVLSRLERLTGEPRFREAAEKQLRFLAGAAQKHPDAHCFTLLVLTEALWETEELVVCAKEEPNELREYLKKPHPGLTVLLKTPESAEALDRLAPFTREYPIPASGAMYYRCHGGVCQRPAKTLI